MKFLFDLQDKYIKPLFEKGGKFENLYPLFEAGDTFTRTPPDVTKGSPHVRDSIDQKRLMVYVIYALTPCILFGIWNAGNQFNIHNGIESTFTSDILRGSLMVLPIIFTSYLVGGICEVGFAIIRKHEINEGFLVSGMLFPLTLAPTTPLWQVALGIAFGIIIGKEIFGGVGYNILNPALTGRAFLFFAYPAQISGDTVWVGSLKDTPIVNKILGIAEPSAGWQALDGVTMATPLAVSAAAENGINAVNSLSMSGFNLAGMVIGNISGSIGSTSVIAILLGLGFLLLTGVASNKIIFSGIAGAAFMGLLFNILPTDNSFANIPFYYHLAMGGFMFGIVFMATDPVSAAATDKGKIVYGFLIGVLTVIIRVANPAYPEGIMLAILFMNVMAPMIDHYVVQGHIKQRTKYARALNHA
ncbi:MAG: NADH:ubiquinone reductase (Na(+)-transporting) subunit B [Verrucomicrobiota bacterium]|nr:NADH:ubiquinone reductase (Na(+)-transporting) subunit B [Verrucomicrobiota bacterium]MEC7908505.1 NADH:ubiquinone reductase (Na(+)-transporting) subunit B [Verrucomicrobiota bacterium]MEC8517710.1 NADH:ubiquinone reductase (Na(+)-transporting) subunit B [Verrucomicrobiota bacterium]MEC8753879.1 NADH:ubiquinone reductase (Na(+)-transporting) subunit B [Verrucomicrobiota bacterium]